MTQAWKFVMPDGTVIAIQGTVERAKAIMAKVAEPDSHWLEVCAYGEGGTIKGKPGKGSHCDAFVPGDSDVMAIYQPVIRADSASVIDLTTQVESGPHPR